MSFLKNIKKWKNHPISFKDHTHSLTFNYTSGRKKLLMTVFHIIRWYLSLEFISKKNDQKKSWVDSLHKKKKEGSGRKYLTNLNCILKYFYVPTLHNLYILTLHNLTRLSLCFPYPHSLWIASFFAEIV